MTTRQFRSVLIVVGALLISTGIGVAVGLSGFVLCLGIAATIIGLTMRV